MEKTIKISRKAKFLNGLLFFLTAWLGIGLSYTSLNKSSLQEMSVSIYGDDAPLMNSHFLEVFTSLPVSILLVVVVVGIFFKRFFIKRFEKIVKTNAIFFILFSIITTMVIFKIVSPILQA